MIQEVLISPEQDTKFKKLKRFLFLQDIGEINERNEQDVYFKILDALTGSLPIPRVSYKEQMIISNEHPLDFLYTLYNKTK